MTAIDDPVWIAARTRAAALADSSLVRAEGVDSWDSVAVRDLIAVALYAIAAGNTRPVDAVGLDELVMVLSDANGYRQTAAAAAARAGDTSEVAAAWRWLTREWDPHDVPARRWDGLPRGIAREASDPAVDVCLTWAASAVGQKLEDQRGALPRRTPVTVVTGPHAGTRGVIDAPCWQLDDAGALAAGPPAAYLVLVTTGGLSGRAEQRHVLAHDLVVDRPGTP